jgi:O-antigen/teichoic acid export membrane protein
MSYLFRARKNIGLKFVAEVLIRSLSFLFIIVIARYLGDRDFGHYSLAYFFAGLLTVFSDFGLNTVLIRDVSRDHRLLGRYVGNIFFLKILFSLALLILSPGVLYLLGYSRELVCMILLSQLYLQGNHFLDFFIAITNGLEKMEYELLMKGLYKVLVVAIPIFFLWMGVGLWGLLIALVGAYGISCLVCGVIVWKRFTPLVLRYEKDFWKQLLRSAWPIGISGLFMTVYVKIDLVMLSLFGVSPSEIGWYSIPVKIVEIFSLFPMLVMAGLFPIFSVLTSEDRQVLKQNYQRALIYLAIISIPLALATHFSSDSWLVFFFGPSFANSVPSLKILIWVVPFIFLNYVLINTLIALNQERMITWGSGLAVVFNIGINCLVLPLYGYLGASWTTVITEVLLSMGFFWFLQRSFVRLALIGTALRLGISAGLMGLPLWGLKSWPWAVVWPLAGGCYGLGLILFRLVTWEDWLLLKRLLTRPLSKLEVEPR